MKKIKQYILIFEDKKGNELTTKTINAFNKKEAIEIKNNIMAESMINSLHKIIIK
jgi:hypothetical protein